MARDRRPRAQAQFVLRLKQCTTLFGGFALAFGVSGPTQAGDEAAADGGATPRHHVLRHATGANLDERVKVLAQALDLDAGQQVQLRTVLEWQRAQLNALWAEQVVPAAYRVMATQAISDQTADRIRAFLNDEQKKRYAPPRPVNPVTPTGDAPNVQAWMDAMKKR